MYTKNSWLLSTTSSTLY